MIKFYIWKNNPIRIDESYNSRTDCQNWLSVNNILIQLSEVDRNMILDIYSRSDTIPDNIYQISKERNINQNEIWTLISKVSKEIAKERGLI
jgi:hypothetical protein